MQETLGVSQDKQRTEMLEIGVEMIMIERQRQQARAPEEQLGS